GRAEGLWRRAGATARGVRDRFAVGTEPREGRPPAEDDGAGDFRLAWSGVDDAWTEAAGDKGESSPRTPRAEKEHPGGSGARPVDDVPWDELADDTKPSSRRSPSRPPRRRWCPTMTRTTPVQSPTTKLHP